jgi:hypothetical protein
MNVTEPKPLLVPQPIGRRLIGVGNTKWFELVKAGKVEVVEVGGRKMAVYASLERLVAPTTA